MTKDYYDNDPETRKALRFIKEQDREEDIRRGCLMMMVAIAILIALVIFLFNYGKSEREQQDGYYRVHPVHQRD